MLRTDFAYDSAGNQYLITDPRGILTQFNFDLLGRKDQEIDDSTGGSPATGKNVTNFAYDGDNNILTMQAYQPNGTTSPSQTTAYLYGVGGTAGTNLFSNDLLSKVEYPDPTTGNPGTAASDDVLTTYDLLGEPLTKTDQNQTTHSFSYDILGRLKLDSVTTLGSGVDGSVRALGYTYSPLGQPYQQASYSDAAGTVVVNQIQDSYNGYGQLIGQYQAISGAVNTTNTPVTQYTYSQPSGANYSRLTSMIYPNGRVLDYVYNSGLDSDISRVSALADDGGSAAGNLQSYTYLGLNIIVQEADANGVALSYIQQPGDTLAGGDGGDRYTGLDRFGRVIDQNYVNTSTGISTDRFQFAYDRNSNALYENNLLNSSFSELFHANSTASGDDATAYDSLNRITGFERGTLSASANNGGTLDTVSSPTGFFNSQSWNYDSVGNITSDTGARYGSETRTANSQNELTDVNGSVNLLPTYDSNGNMTGDGLGNTFVYDAWNRPVTVEESSSVVYSFSYMAVSTMASSTDTNNFTTTDFYYSADGHEIEDRQGSAVTAQYVWGLGAIQNLVLRDDNSVSGSLGKTGSGLGERIFVQHDVTFNVTALTDPSGNVLERWVYAPYGESNAYSATWNATGDLYAWVYTFQTGRVEKYLGLKFGARNYDPLLQVWMEADPAQYIDGLDRYQLDLSNPVNRQDPVGLSCKPGEKFITSVDVVVLPLGINPDLDEARDFGIKFLGSLDWYEKIVSAVETGTDAVTVENWWDLFEVQAKQFCEPRKLDAQALCEKLKNMLDQSRGDFGGWNVYTRVNYRVCTCKHFFFGLFSWNSFDDETNPWQAYEKGGFDFQGTYADAVAAYVAGQDAAQEARDKWEHDNLPN